MIYLKTNLGVADNSGAQEVQCLKVIGGSMKKCATIGDEIVVSIRKALPKGKVKKGDVFRAVVIRTVKELQRPDGSTIRFDSNSAVLLDKQRNPIATRIFGPVPRELRNKNFMRIVSLAPEVL